MYSISVIDRRQQNRGESYVIGFFDSAYYDRGFFGFGLFGLDNNGFRAARLVGYDGRVRCHPSTR